ncbi:MAG: hypothetical protein RIE76_10020, partial [Parvibaculum sp.]
MSPRFGKDHLTRMMRDDGPAGRALLFLKERIVPVLQERLLPILQLGVSRLLFVGIVIVPSVLAIIYYGFWASDRYVSTSLMTV